MRASLRGAVLAAAAGLVLAAAQPAHAQGFALERYEPTPAGSWFFGAINPWYSSTRWFAGGLTLDYGHDPLLAGLYDTNGNFHETKPVVEHMLVGHIDLAGSFLDRVNVNASLPITLYEGGSSQFGVSPSSATVGDVRLGAFVRAYGQPEKENFSLSLGGYVWIPVGVAKDHEGDKTARGLIDVIAAGLVKNHIRYAANLGVLIRAQSSIGFGPSNSSGTELQANFAIAYADTHYRFQVGPEIMFGTVLVGDHAFKNGFTNLDILVGGQYNIAHLINVGLAVGAATLSEIGTPDARLIMQIAYAPIKKEKVAPVDTDKDGIIDPEDACPLEPGPRTNDPKTNGCPDRDHDGIPDSDDLCPDQPVGAKPDASKKGCPVVDGDNDGVPDSQDMCPGQAAGDHPDPKRPGCPFIDSDNDGVPDSEDQCPNEAPGKYPDAQRKGCPMPDADQDGIPDAMDACPNVKGIADANDPKQNGCPKIELKRGGTTELRMVNFEFNKAILLEESKPVLDVVAKLLKDHPEFRKIVIEGHASDEGTKEWNLRLSKHRAQAVMEYLIKQGVKRGRLDYVGYGDTRPLVDEKTEEARAKNRRVEVHILDEKK